MGNTKLKIDCRRAIVWRKLVLGPLILIYQIKALVAFFNLSNLAGFSSTRLFKLISQSPLRIYFSKKISKNDTFHDYSLQTSLHSRSVENILGSYFSILVRGIFCHIRGVDMICRTPFSKRGEKGWTCTQGFSLARCMHSRVNSFLTLKTRLCSCGTESLSP